jgi:hypothetical protein
MLCTIHADLSELSQALQPKKSGLISKSTYYAISFEVVILFGQTELEAQISWKHKVCAFWSVYFLADQIRCKGR